jgi:hypothetical protein
VVAMALAVSIAQLNMNDDVVVEVAELQWWLSFSLSYPQDHIYSRKYSLIDTGSVCVVPEYNRIIEHDEGYRSTF